MLEPEWSGMQKHLQAALSTDVENLRDVNVDVLTNGGKMIRPMIALLIARACGKSNENSVLYATATELIHNATLLHDDVADESKERRGNPTVASIHGPSTAVLVGDFWLAKAVDLVSGTEAVPRLMRVFSKTLSELAEGEMLQMSKAETADTDEDDYFRIISCKTASLFEAAAVSAAISVKASPEMEAAAEKYSQAFGIAFQIKDDILDYTGGAGLGKPVGIDIREQKITLPLLGAIKNTGNGTEIRKMISEIHGKPEYSEEIRRFVLENGGVEYAGKLLEKYIGEAIEALGAFPDCEEKEALAEIARFNALRTR